MTSTRRLSREELDAGLDNPNDPYGMAHKSETVLKYLASMQCGEVERYEMARRERIRQAR